MAGIAIVMGMLFMVSTTSTFAQGRYRDRQTGGEKAATIAGGAGIGAVVGSIVGGGKGALIGGLIGAGVGTGVVAHKNNQDRYGYYDNRYYNSGYNNSGYNNSGYYNSGYNNSGYYNSGYGYNRYNYRTYRDHDRYRDNDDRRYRNPRY